MGTLRGAFDEVVDSVRNGQRRQAAEQMRFLDVNEVCDLVNYCAEDLSDTDLALDIAKTFIKHNGYTE